MASNAQKRIPQKLKKLMPLVKDVPGDFAEIGVYLGETFHHVVRYANNQKREAHAFDSFRGMAERTEHDHPKQYSKGAMSVGGPQKFQQILSNRYKVSSNDYKMFVGYIPSCFDSISDDQIYAFVYLDVDHYQPTKIALEWVWKHIPANGILMLDDYFPNRGILASKAIDEWLIETKEQHEEIELVTTQLVLKKLRGES